MWPDCSPTNSQSCNQSWNSNYFRIKLLFSVNGVWCYLMLFLEVTGMQYFCLLMNAKLFFFNWFWIMIYVLFILSRNESFGLIWLFGSLHSALLPYLAEGGFLSTICWLVSITCWILYQTSHFSMPTIMTVAVLRCGGGIILSALSQSMSMPLALSPECQLPSYPFLSTTILSISVG